MGDIEQPPGPPWPRLGAKLAARRRPRREKTKEDEQGKTDEGPQGTRTGTDGNLRWSPAAPGVHKAAAALEDSGGGSRMLMSG
jgi:hypothetical protein